jgi:hypothetical protein
LGGKFFVFAVEQKRGKKKKERGKRKGKKE